MFTSFPILILSISVNSSLVLNPLFNNMDKSNIPSFAVILIALFIVVVSIPSFILITP